jgi:3-oxoacyl-[acyl-carrier-protein] synthase-3
MKSSINNVSISSIATCVPKGSIDLIELGNKFGFPEVERVCKTTGIYSIREASENTTTSDLCLKAAELIFNKEPGLKEIIDGIVFVSQTADYKLPQTSHIIQHKLGLNSDTICFDMPIGCNGYIYGLYQASLLISSSSCNNVLVLVGDTTTKLINKKDRSVRLVFGDAGTATIVRKTFEKSNLSFIIKSDGSGYNDLIIPSGGSRSKFSVDSLIESNDQDGNIRSESDLFMDGMAIFNFAIKCVPEIINETLIQSGWGKEQVSLFAIHQANKFMVDYLRKKIQVDQDKMPIAIDGFGNTGPASIPLLLTERFSSLTTYELSKVILCGFGVGLSWGTVACDLIDTKIYKTIIY